MPARNALLCSPRLARIILLILIHGIFLLLLSRCELPSTADVGSEIDEDGLDLRMQGHYKHLTGGSRLRVSLSSESELSVHQVSPIARVKMGARDRRVEADCVTALPFR